MVRARPTGRDIDATSIHPEDDTMQWTTPAFTELRFGFEVTMYIANR